MKREDRGDDKRSPSKLNRRSNSRTRERYLIDNEHPVVAVSPQSKSENRSSISPSLRIFDSPNAMSFSPCDIPIEMKNLNTETVSSVASPSHLLNDFADETIEILPQSTCNTASSFPSTECAQQIEVIQNCEDEANTCFDDNLSSVLIAEKILPNSGEAKLEVHNYRIL